MGDAVTLGNIFGAPIEEVRFARDSPLERTGFELAVPLRWTALRSEVVEEAFGSARYDERGRPQRPAVQLVLLRKPFHASDGPFWSGGLRRAVP